MSGGVSSRRICIALTCAVLAMLGPVAAAADAARAWLAPVDLSVAGQNASVPQVAVDPAGNSIAVWQRLMGINTIIQSAVRPAGGSWQTPVDLSASGQNANAPQVAVDSQGNAVAVWLRFSGTNNIVQSAVRPAGGSWQATVDLSTVGQNADGPQVAIDPQGNATAVWSRSNGPNTIIQGAQHPAGGSWQTPVDVSVAGQNADTPQIAVDPHGDAVAVWRRFDGTNTIVQGAVRPTGGSWQAPADLSVAGQNALVPQVAVDAQGDATAVWQRFNGANGIVQGAVRASGGVWQAPADLSAAGQNADEPQVAVDPQGNAIAVWRRSNGTNLVVQGAAHAAGGSWQAAVNLSAGGQSAPSPQVAFAPQGDAIAVWQRSDGPNTIVEAAARSAAGAWEAPVGLSASNQPADIPQVAVDPQGNAVAVWRRSNGVNFVVQGAGFDAAGPLLRGLVAPASGVAGQPLSFSLSPFDVWSPLGATSWAFGDGAAATGTAVTHTYAEAGTFTVGVSAADALANSTSTTRTITIAPAAAPPPPPPPCTNCDADGDGIPDARDACPHEDARARDENQNGCLDYRRLRPAFRLTPSRFVRLAPDGRRFIALGIRVVRLEARELPRGAIVTLTCSRHACKTQRVRAGTKGRVEFKRLRGRNVHAGIRLTLRATQAGAVGAGATYTILPNDTRKREFCISPVSGKAGGCSTLR